MKNARLALLLLFAACAPPEGGVEPEPSPSPAPTPTPEEVGCRQQPAAADRTRAVIVARPYDAGGGQAGRWAVIELDAAGELTDTGQVLEAGRATRGRMAWAPDGSLAAWAQDDGTVGVAAVDGSGVRLVHAHKTGPFYAEAVAIDPSGEWLWVVDTGTVDQGGGLYRAPIDCTTGEVGDAAHFTSSRAARAVVFAEEGPMLVTGGPGDAFEVIVLKLDSEGHGEAWVTLFDEAIVSDAALSADGALLLVTDDGGFTPPTGLSVTDTRTGEGRFVQLREPVAILPSPFDDAVLVVSAADDAVLLDRATWTPATPSWQGQSPRIPGSGAVVERGALRGLVVLSENRGLRRLRFDGEGGIEDLGLQTFGTGLDYVQGLVGVAP